ncbi:MAG: hypothetical protein HY927_12720 [Elusimicrobia bacterium]|nr:hypothetical protein [Elusimicrobiota bacterium]
MARTSGEKAKTTQGQNRPAERGQDHQGRLNAEEAAMTEVVSEPPTSNERGRDGRGRDQAGNPAGDAVAQRIGTAEPRCLRHSSRLNVNNAIDPRK